MKKLKTLKEALPIIEKIREQNKKIVTTNGSFDIIHPAHIRIFEKAKKRGDILIVLLNSDSSIKKNKGEGRPILNQKDRAIILSGIQYIDYIIIFEQETPLEILKRIKPDIHVKGGTFIKKRISQEKELLKLWNGKFITFPIEKGYSTTNIINKILQNNHDTKNLNTTRS